MSLLGFKKQFAGPVEARTKRQTIRAKVHGHVVGRPIQLYTGLRTKACRKLAEVDPICTSIETVVIRAGHIIIAGVELPPIERRDMALLDGFANVFEFYAFFLGRDLEGCFDGFLIRWDWS